MSTAVALSSPAETKWTIISGAMTGTVRLMAVRNFTIGRSPECEFVMVNDPKCSRKHATVEWTAQGCEIACLNENNLLFVNGRPVERSLLHDGDVLTLGETEVQFNLTTLPETRRPKASGHTRIALLEIPNAVPATTAFPSANTASPHAPMRPRKPSAGSPTNPGKIIFYFVLGLIVLWLFTGNGAKKKAELALRTEQQIQADIDSANKLNEAAQNLPGKRLDGSVNTRQAQENYVRGFRDYRKGQFERSLDSFQACLALDPAHVLCNRYIRLAQRRFNELVQYDIVLGRAYRDQNQFQACRAAFRNVMVMVKDANSAAYKEAKANYDACNSMAEGRY